MAASNVTSADLDLTCLEGLDKDSSVMAWVNCLANITKQGVALGLSAAQAQQLAKDAASGRAADAGADDVAADAMAWSDTQLLGLSRMEWLLILGFAFFVFMGRRG